MPPKRSHRKGKKKSGSTQKSHILSGMGAYRSKGSSRRLKGHGGYAEDIGSGIGSWLGKKAGGLFSSIFGVGSYKVNKNTLLNASPNDPPIISNTKSATRIQHREYITDISGSTAFNVQTYPINPGLSGTFPWLCSVANAFEQYKMHGLLFEFKSTSADALNSTNTALGTLIMATEYNPLHGAFTAKRDMENHVYSTANAPSISALHPVECAADVSVLNELFVRNVPLPTADIRFSDMGLFQLATVGMQAAAVIGELWVTYDIELIKPKLPDAFTAVGPAHYVFNPSGPVLPSPQPPAGPNNTNLFGDPGIPKVALLGTGQSPVTVLQNMIRFNSTGRYLVALNIYTFSGATSTVITPTYGTGVSALPIQFSVGSHNQYPISGTSTFNQSIFDTVNVTNLATATLAYSGFNLSSAVTFLELYVIPLPDSFSFYEEPEMSRIYTMIERLQKQMKSIDCGEDTDESKSSVTFADDKANSDDYPLSSPVLQRSEPGDVHMTRSTTDLVSLLRERLGSK
jgi:hypothetical protein